MTAQMCLQRTPRSSWSGHVHAFCSRLPRAVRRATRRVAAARCGAGQPAFAAGLGLAYARKMADPTSAQENPAPPERMVPLRSVISWAATVAFIIAVIVGAGFIHIVFGDTISVCAKDGWALQDTFVDLDDYAGKPLLAMIDKAKVLRAMFACGTLKRPAFLDEEKPNRRTERPSPGQSTDSTSALSAYKVNMTKLKMSTYATVAFPLWKAAHPGKSCPGSISELKEYLAGTELDDLWGRPVKMLCGANLPAEATGIAFLSRGEDGEEGTSDDVKSWE
jgi:hypothetical protein